MTSTTDTAGHPEVTELSDLVEGLLAPSRSTDVRRHLDECTLCADVHASLEEIRGLLGTLPGAPPMPAEIAGRIDAALAAEALLSAAVPDAGSTKIAVSAEDSPTAVTALGGVRVSRETSAAADRPAGHSRGATGPGRAERSPRVRRRTAVLGTVLTIATLGLGTVFLQAMGGEDADGPVAMRTEDTSTNTFSGDSIENQVTKLLSESRTIGPLVEPKPGTPGAPTDGAGTFRAPSVPNCVRAGIGRSEPSLGVRQGDYQGTEAYLVVLPDASRIDRVTAYVVDAACVSKRGVPSGEVLTQRSYARPAGTPPTGS
ncbi:hypothetical protein [Streptomyces sp. CRN 30]|uniref:anti-sigma factor family protein n=1 Tax=Streptomyces sp. CRN 30 TaxID=3075613 RepID=UPI002A81DD8D|nr:hypothetical protein [Streptomyces sp. CRN 30]